MDSLMIFRGFFGFDFFCLIFVIKGVPGDPSRREGGGVFRAFPGFTDTLKRNKGFSSLRANTLNLVYSGLYPHYTRYVGRLHRRLRLFLLTFCVVYALHGVFSL